MKIWNFFFLLGYQVERPERGQLIMAFTSAHTAAPSLPQRELRTSGTIFNQMPLSSPALQRNAVLQGVLDQAPANVMVQWGAAEKAMPHHCEM